MFHGSPWQKVPRRTDRPAAFRGGGSGGDQSGGVPVAGNGREVAYAVWSVYRPRSLTPSKPLSDMELTVNETRIIGCLMEKAVTTPDHYPLTLNALVNACNQKSSRNPVLALDRGVVQRTARELQARKLLTADENFRTGVVKYRQRFCNTPFSGRQFAADEYAVICLLLLRGPQTSGELRTRGGACIRSPRTLRLRRLCET